jgi:hypothetical protein
MRSPRHLPLVLASGLAACTSAWCQSSNPSSPAPPSGPPAACPPGVGQAAPTVGSGQSNPNLSEQLSQSGGIICPPAGGDTGMTVSPRENGRMPVIPPPGSPGGDQSVKPK